MPIHPAGECPGGIQRARNGFSSVSSVKSVVLQLPVSGSKARSEISSGWLRDFKKFTGLPSRRLVIFIPCEKLNAKAQDETFTKVTVLRCAFDGQMFSMAGQGNKLAVATYRVRTRRRPMLPGWNFATRMRTHSVLIQTSGVGTKKAFESRGFKRFAAEKSCELNHDRFSWNCGGIDSIRPREHRRHRIERK